MNNIPGLYVVVREDSGYEVARLSKNGGWLYRWELCTYTGQCPGTGAFYSIWKRPILEDSE